MDCTVAWQNLEEAIGRAEKAAVVDALLSQTLQAGICILLEYPPDQVVAQVEASRLPTRPTVSWLVFEAGRIPGLDQAVVKALCAHWDDNCSDQGPLIAPPTG